MQSRMVLLAVFAALAMAVSTLAGCNTKTVSPTGIQPSIPSTVGFLQIIVKDESEADITGAAVVSQNQPEGQSNVTAITSNGDSHFSLKPGNYQFAISKDGFQPLVAEINVIGGQSMQITVNLHRAQA